MVPLTNPARPFTQKAFSPDGKADGALCVDNQVLLHGRLVFMMHGRDQTHLLEPPNKKEFTVGAEHCSPPGCKRLSSFSSGQVGLTIYLEFFSASILSPHPDYGASQGWS